LGSGVVHEVGRDPQERVGPFFVSTTIAALTPETLMSLCRSRGARLDVGAMASGLRKRDALSRDKHTDPRRTWTDTSRSRACEAPRMPYDRIGARAGQCSRSWAFQHTMPQDLVDDLLTMSAEAEQWERDAFIHATQAEPVAELQRCYSSPSGVVQEGAGEQNAGCEVECTATGGMHSARGSWEFEGDFSTVAGRTPGRGGSSISSSRNA
ncbi:hypothetical protein JYK22_20105, partial [Nonomuraea sp. RK-328]|nr:hypothetical protein [Nonomuraea sp. RK-328]